MSTQRPEAVLELVNVSKRFGATQALDSVSVSVSAGEFVALLGPNGAGKSTMIKILDGVYGPDSGHVHVRSGRDAMGVVHQDLGLVPTMSIAENMALGRPRRFVNPGKDASFARDQLANVGLADLDPHTLVESLNLGQQALVAVSKVLAAGVGVVIVDELTAGLAANEARWLVQHLRDVAHRGATVVMVTHKLREVVGVADRYVVLLDGRVALDAGAEVSLNQIVDIMSAGRTASNHEHRPNVAERDAREVVCSLAAVRIGPAGPIDLELRRGDVIGLTGLVGSGLHEIAYVAAGRLRPDSGEVVCPPTVRRTCVPAHRETEGMFPNESEEFNLAAGTWAKWRRRTGLLNLRALHNECDDLAQRLAIVPRALDVSVDTLSGGNQQKTLLGRALLDPPDLLVLCEPTRGVDVATRREIYSQIRRVAAGGAAILVATTDLDDLGAVAEQVGLLDGDGRISRFVPAEKVSDHLAELV